MKKEYIYKICIIILFAMNLIQIGGFLITSSRPPRFEGRNGIEGIEGRNGIEGREGREGMQGSMPDKNGFLEEASRMLELNNEQQIKFSEYATAHDMRIRSLQKKQRDLIGNYFNQPSDSVLDLISNIEKQKIYFTQRHLNEVKSILNKDQNKNFDKFKKNAMNIILK